MGLLSISSCWGRAAGQLPGSPSPLQGRPAQPGSFPLHTRGRRAEAGPCRPRRRTPGPRSGSGAEVGAQVTRRPIGRPALCPPPRSSPDRGVSGPRPVCDPVKASALTLSTERSVTSNSAMFFPSKKLSGSISTWLINGLFSREFPSPGGESAGVRFRSSWRRQGPLQIPRAQPRPESLGGAPRETPGGSALPQAGSGLRGQTHMSPAGLRVTLPPPQGWSSGSRPRPGCSGSCKAARLAQGLVPGQPSPPCLSFPT